MRYWGGGAELYFGRRCERYLSSPGRGAGTEEDGGEEPHAEPWTDWWFGKGPGQRRGDPGLKARGSDGVQSTT